MCGLCVGCVRVLCVGYVCGLCVLVVCVLCVWVVCVWVVCVGCVCVGGRGCTVCVLQQHMFCSSFRAHVLFSI